jgi:hypothetical protein
MPQSGETQLWQNGRKMACNEFIGASLAFGGCYAACGACFVDAKSRRARFAGLPGGYPPLCLHQAMDLGNFGSGMNMMNRSCLPGFKVNNLKNMFC